MRIREYGQAHPGFPWGPFVFRVPVYHTRIEWPELAQGVFVAGATGLALVPLLTTHFGLSFEVAVGVALIQALLVNSAPIVFGEPYAAGWLTPALPLVLAFLIPGGTAHFSIPADGFRYMTAVTLEFAVLVLIMGALGVGQRVLDWLPRALKGGIILGASLTAIDHVFVSDGNLFRAQPVSTLVAITICLLLTFSIPLRRWGERHGWLLRLSTLGLLPGFLAAALVGPWVGELARPVSALAAWGWVPAAWADWAQESFRQEVVYQIEWGILWPAWGEILAKVSPWGVGWPTPLMFLETIPLALMAYIIFCSDLITGSEILRSRLASRPDERIEIDFRRSHFSMAIRNSVMALTAPFFPTQGTLWTGVQVLIVERWAQGRNAIDSLYGAISSYYILGVPVLYLVLPWVTLLRPLMPIALSLTLLLTSFACAYVAMGLQRTPVERGAVVLIGMLLTVFGPWVGLGLALLLTVVLVGKTDPEVQAPNGSSRPK